MTLIAAHLLFMLNGLALAESPITGVVVDGMGQTVPAAEVALAIGLTREGTVPIVAQVRSDEAGRFTFDPDASRTGQEAGTIWGFKSWPGCRRRRSAS